MQQRPVLVPSRPCCGSTRFAVGAKIEVWIEDSKFWTPQTRHEVSEVCFWQCRSRVIPPVKSPMTLAGQLPSLNLTNAERI